VKNCTGDKGEKFMMLFVTIGASFEAKILCFISSEVNDLRFGEAS
jgi:hypothetical protein